LKKRTASAACCATASRISNWKNVVLDRRLEQMMAEGVQFQTQRARGREFPRRTLRKEFDAVVLTGGAENPRDLNVPGRELKGIYFAMQFLPQQNKPWPATRFRIRFWPPASAW
jgi:NADPH-dependent glutamate synthase beta subunit-like oxidoreductase